MTWSNEFLSSLYRMRLLSFPDLTSSFSRGSIILLLLVGMAQRYDIFV